MSDGFARDPAVCGAYAADVSGLHEVPTVVARPDSRAEAIDSLRRAAAEGLSVTPAGAQTSTTGASVAAPGGLLLSMSRLDRIIEIDPARRRARVEPGVIVGDLNRALASEGLFFAPDPTSENEATIGGSVACNASGARTLRYGPTRHHVLGLIVALADGTVTEIRRPSMEKNTVGFFPAQDPVDWFVGSEGTLGLVLEVDVALLPLPPHIVGLGIPFPDEGAALDFVVEARTSPRLSARCLEYFDPVAFGFARAAHPGGAWSGEPGTMVYLEEAGDEEADFDGWLELAERHGARDDRIVVFDDESALREARRIRHACPAAMHEATGPWLGQGGRRISTDWAVPFPDARAALAEARQAAEEHGIEGPVVYGHLGNGHPHLNWVAKDPSEASRIERCVESVLKRSVLPRGGTVAAEHGVGKLKTRWLPLQMSPLQLRLMRSIKRELDPEGRLSPGNVLTSI
jgi:FAD/FMN-containing dehydrogenase